MQVAHGYLAGDLFASYHAPAGPPRNVGWVVCLPLHLDLIQSHRSMRLVAEVLAAAGLHVLRVHYAGTTESVGSTDHDPDRVERWLASVRAAIGALAAVPGVESVGLLGVRIGGAFALETATRLDVSHLVLWEPSAGNMYGREMEILASSAPQPDPPVGEGVVAGGYWLSKGTLADLARLELEKMTPRGKPDVLLVYRDDRKAPPRLAQHLERHGSAVTVLQPPGHKEMMVMPQKSAVPHALIDAIRDWAVARSRTIESTGALALAPEIVVDGLRWRTLRFGTNGHLFGVRTEPAGGATRPGVLLLTGGVTPRTAGNNSYVTLAERLAKRGHAVVRMDVSFIGESGTPDGEDGRENDPFPPSILDDARAGRAELPPGPFWVYGLCSGAFAAFQVALGDDRARGAFIVNPERFTPPAPEAAEPALSTADQLEQMNRYLQVIRDPAAWKKLLSGKADVRYLAKVLSARAASKVGALRERVETRLGRAPAKGLAADVDRMLARGTDVHFVFSEGDPGHAATLAELGARASELEAKGMRITTFARADHNFHELSSRAKMLDWVVSTICTARG
ncbi:MAG: hypothetical protein KIT84_09710 [Labilithrix sp.]|nr:hypothetical protein [Labilithrix sp.]MCW5811277.1 hypothetical protein [Labilithrix sp.]